MLETCEDLRQTLAHLVESLPEDCVAEATERLRAFSTERRWREGVKEYATRLGEELSRGHTVHVTAELFADLCDRVEAKDIHLEFWQDVRTLVYLQKGRDGKQTPKAYFLSYDSEPVRVLGEGE